MLTTLTRARLSPVCGPTLGGRDSYRVRILRQLEGGSIGAGPPRGSRYGSTRSIFTLRRGGAGSIIARVTSTTRSPARPGAAGWPPGGTPRWKAPVLAPEVGTRASGESAVLVYGAPWCL